MIDLCNNLYKVFRKNRNKYVIILENSDHTTKTLRKDVNFFDLKKVSKTKLGGG